jgi:hypothetical protein
METPRETKILSVVRSLEKIIIYEEFRFSSEAKKNKGLERAIERTETAAGKVNKKKRTVKPRKGSFLCRKIGEIY